MVKKKINIKYTGRWRTGALSSREQLIYDLLSQRYHLIDDGNPDYVIDFGHGYGHLQYNCIKILFNGENMVPDFNLFDYALGSDNIAFGDRYARIPHFVIYPEFVELDDSFRKQRLENLSDAQLLQRDFCSFIASNGADADPIRESFFYELSKYKRVASGGRFLNNIGEPIADKLEFCSHFKFNIAIENSSAPGYTTEKIMQPLTVFSVPVYYGNPLVQEDFLESCMVRIRDEKDIPRAIEEIIFLDKNNEAYLKKCRSLCLAQHTHQVYYNRLLDFFSMVFEQPLAKARRLVHYGNQAIRKRELQIMLKHDNMLKTYRLAEKILRRSPAWILKLLK